MDGYVYTSFRLVIVPRHRQKSRQKRKLQESAAFGKFSPGPSASDIIENCSFGRPIENRSRVDTHRVDRKSILFRN